MYFSEFKHLPEKCQALTLRVFHGNIHDRILSTLSVTCLPLWNYGIQVILKETM